MLVFFLATGIRFTIESGFFPLTHGKQWFLATFGSLFLKKETRKTEEPHAVSQFQSFCTALAATLGTGNITGVAAAIMTGGPGAVFWTWVSAFLGMMTNYAENYLGIRYRYKDRNGQWVGGAMVYMDRGLSCRRLTVCFSFCCIGASFGMGNMVQSNSLSAAFYNEYGIPVYITGAVAAFLTLLVIVGGIKRISSFTEIFIPVISLLYIAAALFVVIKNYSALPRAFQMIFSGAFGLRAAGGGICGATLKNAVSTGLKRGVFSNEAGLGTSSVFHSSCSSR